MKRIFKWTKAAAKEPAAIRQDAKEKLLSSDSQTGLHLLFEPANATFDVLFLHGLGGHWRETWRTPRAQDPWPQQWLPESLEYGRIFSIGYDSHIFDWRRMVSQNTVTDHANNLLRDLSNYRDNDDTNDQPIFFVVHSLGGLVCEDALVRSRNSPEKHIQQILACTKGIIFLGTPHSGTEALATWAKALATSLGFFKQTNPDILEGLQKDSELLYRIQGEFHTMIRDRTVKNESDIEIVCFFEEVPTRGVGLILTRESASLARYRSTSLPYNHSDMTKFKDAKDPAFLAVAGELRRWSKALRPMINCQPSKSDLPASQSENVFGYSIDHFYIAIEPISSTPNLSIDSYSRSPTIPHFPHSRNPNFVGCNDVLQAIQIRLSKESRVALNGIGGVGKTEIATEYCYRFWSSYPDVLVFWVPCDSLTKIELAFSNLAQILDLRGNEEPDTDMIQLVSRHLQQGNSKPWLLVLDNADDSELMTEGTNALAKLVPQYRGGTVLITTRDRYVAQALTGTAHGSLTVNRLSPQDALTLFRSKLPGDAKLDEAVEFQILEILEYLPLCITQAAAYIDRSDVNLHEYLLELSESEASLMEVLDEDHIDLRRGFDSPNSVLRAWKLSFEKIRLRYSQAGEILSIMAFLDRQHISRDMLQGIVQSRHKLNLALGVLQGFCLIAPEIPIDSFKMHRLVQLATRFWLFGRKTEYESLALKVVAASFSQHGSEDYCEQTLLLPHAKAVENYTFQDKDNNLKLAGLQYSIASYEFQAGHYDAAAKSCQGAHGKHAVFSGESKLDTLHSAGLLGVIKRYQGRYEEARLLQEDVLSKKEYFLGADNIDTIETVSDLSDVLERQGHYDGSQLLAERAIAVRQSRLGEANAKTLQSQMHLALVLRRQAKYKEAEALGRKVLEGYERTLPKGHEATLKSAYALAGVLRESGQFVEAVAISEMVVEGRTLLLGDNHPQTLLAINNLALGYRLKGELERAERLYRHVCEAHDKSGRQNYPDALTAHQNLAVVLREQGKYQEAEKTARHTLAGRERLLGHEHLSTVNTALDLAMTLELQKAYTEAESLASLVLAVRTRKLGEAHTYTLETLFTLASIKQNTGRLDDSTAMFRKVLAGRIEVLGPDHPATKATEARLASLNPAKSVNVS